MMQVSCPAAYLDGLPRASRARWHHLIHHLSRAAGGQTNILVSLARRSEAELANM